MAEEYKMKIRKIIRNVICAVIVILIVAVTILGILFRRELKTLSTLKEYKPGVYTMTYDGDYGFDTFLEYGATSDKEIEEFVTKRLLKGIPIKFNVTDAGCTAFVSANENGEVIFARNFDFEYAPFMQIYTNPDNGYASVSTVNLSFAGYGRENLPTFGISINNFLTLAAPFLPFDGMNEKGVCMALLAVPEVQMTNDPDKITLNTTTAIRLVLDKAESVDEAIELLSQYNIYFSGDVECHFLIADATGKSVIVEYYDGGLQVVESDKDYQIASNFIAYNGVNIGEGFTEFERYDEVEKVLIESKNAVSMDACENLLNRIGVEYEGIDKLQWSVVYNLTERSGRIWPHRNSDDAWNFEID